MQLVLALVLAAALVASRIPPGAARAVTRVLDHRLAPVAVFVASTAVFGWVWGSLRALPIIHDEVAYVLQARIFASGRWTAPSPPLPEFWEQFHVFVTPALAPKYPPGHAVLMVPGIWLGLPGLVPVVLLGFTAMLLFVVARELSDGATALLAVVLWTGAPGVLTFFPSYYSESTTCALWLAGWWLLLRWRDSRRAWLLWALAAVTGWGAITRPLTMLVFAVPVAVVVLRDAWTRQLWRDVAVGIVIGTAILGIVPVWSARTLGDAGLNPYSHYSELYFPFDRPGFGADTTAPRRPLPPDMQKFLLDGHARRAAHLPAALPAVLGERLAQVGRDTFGGWRALLIPAAVVGLVGAPAALRLALGTSLLLVLAYLGFSHPAHWSLYYVEIQAVLAFTAATGAARIFGWLFRAPASPGVEPQRRVTILAVTLVLAGFLSSDLSAAKQRVEGRAAYHTRFHDTLRAIHDPAAVVFVRYMEGHNIHLSLIENEPDTRNARIWVVRDRGADNFRLLRLAPGRVAYVYDERTSTLTPLAPAAR